MIDRSDVITVDPKVLTELRVEEGERTRCEVWTRVMGYHRPVAAWNPGKRSEHAERCYYAALDN